MALWVRSRADAAKAKKLPVLWSFRSPRAELAPNCCWYCCCGCNRLRVGEEADGGEKADSATDSRGNDDEAGVEAGDVQLLLLF